MVNEKEKKIRVARYDYIKFLEKILRFILWCHHAFMYVSNDTYIHIVNVTSMSYNDGK